MQPVYTPSQLEKGFRALFIEQLMMEPMNLVADIATMLDSQSNDEDIAWLGDVGPIEEAEDELTFYGLSDTSYNLENKKYWGGLAIKRDDLNDDKVGGLRIRVMDLAQRARRKPNGLLIDALTNGTTATDFTGEAFFTATHTARGKASSSGELSNLITGDGTSTANCATNISEAIAALYNYEDEAGEIANEGFSQIFIVYPPALHKPISEAVRAGIISNTTNVQFGDHNINLIQTGRLTSDSAVDYYIGISDALVRGLVWQDREPVTFEAQEQGDTAFLKEVYAYKARFRGRAGYGRWQRLVKINNT